MTATIATPPPAPTVYDRLVMAERFDAPFKDVPAIPVAMPITPEKNVNNARIRRIHKRSRVYFWKADIIISKIPGKIAKMHAIVVNARPTFNMAQLVEEVEYKDDDESQLYE